MFEINPKLEATLLTIGYEQSPVVVVDNFMVDYSGALAEAHQAIYSDRKEDVGQAYPGIRAPLRKDYGIAVVRFAALVLHKHLHIPTEHQVLPVNANYSLLSKLPEDLSPQQCIPHFDTSRPGHYAILHYLNDGAFGGTSFYRHKPSGFENITPDREAAYFESVQAFIKQHGAPQQAYFTDSDGHYDLMHKVDYKPNRLLIYPTSLLHSAYIDNPSRDLNPNPHTGRLSTNFLIHLVEKTHA